MHFRWRRRGLPRSLLFRLVAWAMVLLVVGIIVFEIIDKNTAPVIIDMAESKVRAASVKAMNDAVRAIMSNPLKYTDLIKISKDNNGKIMMIQADTVKMNDIATSAALTTQDNIARIGDQGVGIPIGSVLGGQLLAGRGPLIFARIIPVGSVTTDFDSEFQNQGINQTRHKIYLNIHTTVRIVVPMQSKEITVDTKVLITECIIIGEVPNSYVNVSDLGELSDLNLLPKTTAEPK